MQSTVATATETFAESSSSRRRSRYDCRYHDTRCLRRAHVDGHIAKMLVIERHPALIERLPPLLAIVVFDQMLARISAAGTVASGHIGFVVGNPPLVPALNVQ